MQIPLAIQRQTPPGMLSQRMQHMIQKPNPRIDSNSLTLRSLTRMSIRPIQQPLIRILRKRTPIQINRQHDFRLIRIARERRGAYSGFRDDHVVMFAGTNGEGWISKYFV
jgi:hypothetical protein